jgi:hypothetical protein
MSAYLNQPHDFQTIALLVMLAVALCVKFWRTTLTLLVIAVLTFTVYGAVLLSEGLQHAHH